MGSVACTAAALAALLFFASGCAEGASSSGHDAPVSPNEAREELVLVLDLPRSASCEEQFDLAIYRLRGVELVRWDASALCTQRRATIRFLPKLLPRSELLDRVRALSPKVSVEKS